MEPLQSSNIQKFGLLSTVSFNTSPSFLGPNRIIQSVFILFAYSLLSACSTNNTPSLVHLTVSPSPVNMTVTTSPFPTSNPSRTPAQTQTLAPSPTPAIYPSLAGLYYWTEKGHYRINLQGVPEFLSERIFFSLSPNGETYLTSDWDDLYLGRPRVDDVVNLTQSPGVPSYFEGWYDEGRTLIYSEVQSSGNTDLFRLNIESGESSPLTQSPTSDESLVALWPGRTELALISVRDDILPRAPTSGIQGRLFLLNLDTQSLQQISSEDTFDPPSFAPAIAGQPSDRFFFRDGQQAYLYIFGIGLQPYQLPKFDNINNAQDKLDWFAAPSWSPNGRWCAWEVVYQGKTGWLVVDSQTNTARLFHLITHIGMGSHLDPARFSPDSRWLVIFAHAEASELRGVWLYALDSEEAVQLPGDDVLFGPDGKQLVVLKHEGEQNTLTLVNYQTWEQAQINLPAVQGITTWKK